MSAGTETPDVEPTGRVRVLCVDDDPSLLDGLRRELNRRFDITTALSGAAGLEALEREGPFAVVVSDMRMPGMDGATFLGHVRERAPETVRVLLTGHADLDGAIAAVNQGNIFRFLTKPCPRDMLIEALETSARAYHQGVGQREDAEVAAILSEVAETLGSCVVEGHVWHVVVEQARDVLGMEWAIGFRWDTRTSRLRLAAAAGLPDPLVTDLSDPRFRIEDVTGAVQMASDHTVTITDQLHLALVSGATGWVIGSRISVPLMSGEETNGWLIAGYNRQGVSLTPRQVRLAEGIAYHARVALEHAQLVVNLERAEQLKSEFVANMSHELRTPLNVIMGYTAILREDAAGPVTTRQRELLDRVNASSRELLELVESTLNVRSVATQDGGVNLAAEPLSEFVTALRASITGLGGQPGVAFQWDVSEKLAGTIVTDRAKAALVVRNLVSNAFKFTSDGSVTVRVKPEAATVAIEVADTGIGIAPEHIPIIFEKFRQIDGSSTRRYGGMGLGLYLVDQFVRKLGGTIEVASSVGSGTTFRVILPGYRPDVSSRSSEDDKENSGQTLDESRHSG